ncbi:ABC transporter substrate-binding protein [Streptomyces sp. TLI_171]|uniref:ABC transporter substrate-binding protein n=1 Tax=Streptomyces sp. TLI_171 TaxID=1938859 RepID=UPI000C1995A2|nr:ABC transporter substrate-binding protein [Streptomyces sp. TLI_171]RKE20964.1 peptide/nickel transport system substrate-binding protein [Streptomyces sp. TLI_171]
MRLRKAAYVPAMLAISALTLTGCSSGHNTKSGDGNVAKSEVQNFGLGTLADSTGPAKDVAGAKPGGVAHGIEPAGIDYLDPGQIYVNEYQALAQLYSRSLTGYKTDPATGKTILVGDLATDTGKLSDEGKTWTYTLKDNLKFEDGTPITSKDVKYGIERLYADYQDQGPTYIQTWLSGQDYRKVYQGPYDGKELGDDVIGTPDDKTIVFHFKEAHADTPYAVQMPNITAIQKSKDDKEKYNDHPVSIGPYKIASYEKDKSLKLVKNPNWDPKSDPIRHQYVDSWEFELSIANPLLTQRLLAENGEDKNALTLVTNADNASIAKIQTDQATYKDRLVNKFLPFVDVFDINTTRVKDPKVRKALALAFPRAQVQKLLGGAATGDLATNLVSPTVAGWKDSDPLGLKAKPEGDPEAAKALLKEAGAENYPIVLAYANTPRWQPVAAAIQEALNNSGFKVDRKELDPTSYYSVIGKKDNGFDLYRSGWGADWPVASTVVPPTLDGRTVADGSPNYSHYNSDATNTEIDRINKMTDVTAASAEWMKLADKALADVPQIPAVYDKFFQVYGSGLGGVAYNEVIGAVDVSSIYVK